MSGKEGAMGGGGMLKYRLSPSCRFHAENCSRHHLRCPLPLPRLPAQRGPRLPGHRRQGCCWWVRWCSRDYDDATRGGYRCCATRAKPCGHPRAMRGRRKPCRAVPCRGQERGKESGRLGAPTQKQQIISRQRSSCCRCFPPDFGCCFRSFLCHHLYRDLRCTKSVDKHNNETKNESRNENEANRMIT